MVCIYCSGPTSVTNSRLQKQLNQIWRRRHCERCNAVFSTHEAPQLSGSLILRASSGALHPFSRDKLFLSIYESCKHRKNAIDDTSAITLNIIGRLSGFSATGEILRKELINIVLEVLNNFDRTAASVYAGIHSA
jgi:transcriptional regulator NrdR family protein